MRQRIDTTASGFAPALTAAGVNSCAGSASAGVGATGFNFGFGATYEMIECTRRAYAASLAGLGQNAAALDVLCQNAEVRASLNHTGVICPSQRAALVAQAVETGSQGQAYSSSRMRPDTVYRRPFGTGARAYAAPVRGSRRGAIYQQPASTGRTGSTFYDRVSSR